MFAAVMSNEPFFRREGARYQPTPSSRGPWDPKSLHGRVSPACWATRSSGAMNDAGLHARPG